MFRIPEPHLSSFEGLLGKAEASLGISSFSGHRARLTVNGSSSEGSKGDLLGSKWHVGDIKCGETMKVKANSDKWELCPPECPLFAKYKDGDDKSFCSFGCVGATVNQCRLFNPDEPIVDLKRGICRDCWVAGCKTCAKDGTDTCLKCNNGFELQKDGTCYNTYFIGWVILFCVIGLLILLIALWMFDLSRRPITNEKGLQWGLAQRSRAKLHMPKAHVEEGEAEGAAHRTLWPITTNLLRTQVAGPGILLQFNFQLIIIIWAAAVGLAWYSMATGAHQELLELGTHLAETPRQNCIVVAYGYKMQQELMWAKIDFTLGLYITSFIMALLHSVRQLRMFQMMDSTSTTHKDFAARLSGLPKVDGTVKIEEELKTLLAKETGEVVVGVSVGYDYAEKEQELVELLEEDLKSRETGKPVAMSVEEALHISEEMEDAEEDEEGPDGAHKEGSRASLPFREFKKKSGYVFRKLESIFMHPTVQKMLTRGGVKIKKDFHEEEETPEVVMRLSSVASSARDSMRSASARLGEAFTPRLSPDTSPVPVAEVADAVDEENLAVEPIEEEEFDVVQELAEMMTTHEAFVVFESEISRNKAIKAFNEKAEGVEYSGCKLEMEEALAEPDTVLWPNLAVHDFNQKLVRGVCGIGVIIIALCVWAIAFYLPYAYFVVFASSFDHGAEPDMISSTTFSMVVVAGNAMMYFVCSEVADRIGLHYVDDREVVYMLLYAFACISNVALDLVTTYVMAYEMMVGQGMRTWDGKHLKDVSTFTDRFEAYAMQRALGEQLMAYSMPATFLIPFIIEPFGTIYLPYKIMTLLIRSHADISADEAECYLCSLVMDLSRYADLLLNVMLASLVFFFPGGFVVPMFFGLAASHCWIYIVDHYRVLHVVRKCNYAAMSVDWWAQWMLSIPLGFLASTLVFKANCQVGYLGIHKEPPFCDKDGNIDLLLAMILAFLAHVVVHTVLLVFVVPIMGRRENPPSQDSYRDCAESLACSWFTGNPIYCLRSKYVYKHDPPCDYALVGKEHLMKLNEEIGQYFTDTQAESEEFDKIGDMQAFRHEFRKSASSMFGFSSSSLGSPTGSPTGAGKESDTAAGAKEA